MGTDEPMGTTGDSATAKDVNAASSELTCRTYMDFWVAGHRGDFIEEHVHSCFICRAVLLGEGGPCAGTLDDEADALLARRDRRRRFLFAAAAGLLALGAGGWTFRRLTATKVPATVPSLPTIATGEIQLDGTWGAGGDAAIRQQISNASDKDLRRIFQWIVRRQKSTLYGDIVAALGDARVSVVRYALVHLRTIPPSALKSHLALMQSMHALQADPILRSGTAELILIVNKS